MVGEADRARAELEQAKALILEKDRALQTATLEQESLKAEVAARKAEVAASVAEAEMDAVKAYKDGFKDKVDYLFLMRDAVNEYKASIKRVDPTFDGDHYDRLISSEPDTPAPEDSDDNGPEEAEPGQENASAKQPLEAPATAPPS